MVGGHTILIYLSPLLGNPSALPLHPLQRALLPGAGFNFEVSFKILLGFQLEITSFPAKLSLPSKVPQSSSLIISNVCPYAEPQEALREAPSQHIWGSAGKPAYHFPSGPLFSWGGGGEESKDVEMFAAYSALDISM